MWCKLKLATRLCYNTSRLTTPYNSYCSGKLAKKKRKTVPSSIPSFHQFLATSKTGTLKRTPEQSHPYLSAEMLNGHGQLVYLDVHGCQMNVNDTEVVWSILHDKNYTRTENVAEADIWLIVTCSIRESAEAKIWTKLRRIQTERHTRHLKPTLTVGLLGCMAERLKDRLICTQDRLVDVVAGPDSYRDLPRLLAVTQHSDSASINVMLSLEETYADVRPVRLNQDAVTGFVSIQRGCDNMCSYCIVPFTRGKERSRPVETIVDEVRAMVDQGVKEVTLLGQNVNSYRDTSTNSTTNITSSSRGFKTIYKAKKGGLRFADLLHKVSQVDPELRVRFTSPHPKDFPDEVLQLIAGTANVCKSLHLPAQCGSSRILEAMRRGYTRESYLELVEHVKRTIKNVRLSGDMIAGFCGETEQEFEQTLDLIDTVQYGTLFCYPYSLREKTHAHRQLEDNVPESVKKERMNRMIARQKVQAEMLNSKLVNTRQLVLIEGDSKRSDQAFQGRTDGNTKVIFPKQPGLNKGDYVPVDIHEYNSLVVKGLVAGGKTTLAEWALKDE